MHAGQPVATVLALVPAASAAFFLAIDGPQLQGASPFCLFRLGRLLGDLDQNWLAGGIHASIVTNTLNQKELYTLRRDHFFTASQGAVFPA
jgi:hypothetical protein